MEAIRFLGAVRGIENEKLATCSLTPVPLHLTSGTTATSVSQKVRTGLSEGISSVPSSHV